jgi:hypothetical protein
MNRNKLRIYIHDFAPMEWCCVSIGVTFLLSWMILLVFNLLLKAILNTSIDIDFMPQASLLCFVYGLLCFVYGLIVLGFEIWDNRKK